MNWRRGLFRLWIIFSVLWLVGTAFVLVPVILEEWDVARRMKEFDRADFVSLVPADCQAARGRAGTLKEGADYEIRDGKCWYDLPKMRSLYPEYADLTDKDLLAKAYQKAGIPLKGSEPEIWISQLLLIGFGIPALILVVGTAFAWAFRGFSAG